MSDIMNDENEVFSCNDDSDIIDETIKEFEEHCWPEPPEEPSGFTFKGRKRSFIKCTENLKIKFKKGFQNTINDVSFKVLDVRNIPHGV